MKLDSIVYDYGSLQLAIIDTLNSESPTFQAIYPSDTATSLANVLASYGAMLQYQIVSAMANAYTDSAYSEAGIYQLAETLGNRLHGNISSQLYCNITRTNLTGIGNVVIPAGSRFMVEGLNFFNPESVIFPLETNTITNVKLVQGILQVSEQVTSGISGEKLYFCEDFKCNTNMVKVFVNEEEWDITDSFLPYVVTDTSVGVETQVVILKTDSDGRTYIKFGNNSNGILPAKGSTVRIEYITNEGADGNLNNNELTINLTTPIFYTISPNTREQLQVEITAVSTASGGFNTQSIETLRQSSPYVFASGQRAVRRNDYKSMLLNKCGYLTCNVWGEYEEAAIQGGYDKIMMNMVYYSGIKSIQKYDLQPINTLALSLTEINNFPTDFYNTVGNISSARGFLGSYIIDISSFDAEGSPITLKYRDTEGTGVLTCDPSINSNFPNFEQTIFPNNDFLDRDIPINISTNQAIITYSQNNPNIMLEETGEYTSSGIDMNNQPMVINFDNPFQIKLDFEKKLAIPAFAFKTPTGSEGYNKFIYKFAIYGTNMNIPTTDNDSYYTNVKNNSQWAKLTGIRTFDKELSLNSFSDWITTNVYDPDSMDEDEEDLSAQCESESTATFFLHDLINDDYSYTVKVNQTVKPANTYNINKETGELTFIEPVAAGSTVIVEGILYDWIKYKHYLIEVYAIQDSSIKSPKSVSLQQIKALYKDSVSTINYSNNNMVNLNIPIISVTNLVNAYTKAGEKQLSSTWLVDKAGNQIIPDNSKLYYVNDTNTFDTVINLVDGGLNYQDEDIIQICYYTYNIGLSQTGEGYEVGEIFTINDKKAIITAVTASGTNIGAIQDAEFIGLDKFGSDLINVTGLEMDAGSYHGNGTGATFNILSIQSPTLSTAANDYPTAIKTKITTAGNGEITELADTNVITCYNATTNANLITAYGMATPGIDATFGLTSTLNTELYNGKIFKFVNDNYVEDTTSYTKMLGLPETMQYYEYKVSLSGVTEANGYRTGNVLSYSITTDNITYIFKVQITNIAAQDFNITVGTDTTYQSSVLRGKSGLAISNEDLITETGTPQASGAKISIISTSTVNIYGTYTGNFYTNSDIQAFDLPVINKYNHFTTYLEFKQPHIKNIQIEIEIEYENVTTYQTVKNNVIKAINGLFDLHPYSIGSGLNVSDIWKAVNNIEGIKRFNIITPTNNIVCLPYEVLMLPAENLIINDILNSEYK